MAAPSYVSDQTLIDDGSGTFTEPTSALGGTLSSADTDNPVQGTTSAIKTAATGLCGIGILDGAAHTITSPNAYYCWVFVGSAALLNTYANGGLRLIIGNTSANYRAWYVDGNDFNSYGGWQCIAIETDNAVVASDAAGTVGSPSSVKQYFGAVWNSLINVTKSYVLGADALRWGRTVTITAGETANYATFAGLAAANDGINARWGMFQGIAGGYQLQGRLLLGVTGGTAVDFRDTNRSIVTAVSRKVAASFNAIEVQNTSSRVDWDSIAWTALGTVSRGTFTVTDDCDVNITGCSFTGLSTFSLKAGTDVLDSIFRQCDTVTAPGSNLSGSQFLLPRVAADTGAVVWNVNANTNGKLDNTVFSKGTNAHHAITLGALTPASLTLTGITFTGFNASDGQNDSVLLLADKGTNTVWTINASGCTGTVSYKKARAGDTVTINVDQVTLTIEVRDSGGALITDSTEITLVRVSDLTVLAHAEDVTSGSTGYTYGYAGDVNCYVNVLSVDNYVPRTVEPVVLGASNQTVVVQLEDERGRYNNP
jgi:hypothetical protein